MASYVRGRRRTPRLSGLHLPASASGVEAKVCLRTGVMVAGFLVYVVLVLVLPPRPSRAVSVPASAAEEPAFRAGRRVWLRAHCQNCHSIYGLGGHLGPDLTNVVSRRPEETIRQSVLAGRPGMPRSELDETDFGLLLHYLAVVDASGRFPDEHAAVFGSRP